MKQIFLLLIFFTPVISFSQELEINSTSINNKYITFFNAIGYGAKYDQSISKKYKIEFGFSRYITDWTVDTLNDKDTAHIKLSSHDDGIQRSSYFLSFLFKLDSAKKISVLLGPFFGLQSFVCSEEGFNSYYKSNSACTFYKNFSMKKPIYRCSAGFNVKIEFPGLIFKRLSFVFSMMPGIIFDNKIISSQKGVLPCFYYPRLYNEINWGLKFRF